MQDNKEFEETLLVHSVDVESDDFQALLLPGRAVSIYGVGADRSDM